jgi:hypothetical protein
MPNKALHQFLSLNHFIDKALQQPSHKKNGQTILFNDLSVRFLLLKQGWSSLLRHVFYFRFCKFIGQLVQLGS